MNFETLQFETVGHVGVLKINRPQALNSLNAQVVGELKKFLDGLKANAQVRALIVTGAGEKAFVAGADIKEMEARDPNSGHEMALEGQGVFQRFEELPIPVIAAVNGFALGGGLELAMACDFIIAVRTAKMGLPEVSLGLIPGYGGTQRLARYCGKAVARMVALTGEMFTAEQFEKWGLVSLTVADNTELMATAMKYAEAATKRSPVAVKLAKRSITEGVDRNQAEGMKLEASLFGEVFRSEDKREGVKAFVEKRSPNFPGK